MLIVVEGQSAVGKTTWVQPILSEQVAGEELVPMPPNLGRREAHPYFVEANAQRWARMLRAEETYGVAYADSDPLKLYYEWALVAIGELDRETFRANWRLDRAAMTAGRYGFADHVIYLCAAEATLRTRKQGDTTRRRGGFALHVRLGKAMRAYYTCLERLRPRTVHWLDTEQEMSGERERVLKHLKPHGYARYDVAVLDQLEADLLTLLAVETQWE